MPELIPPDYAFEVAAISEPGTERDRNEDHSGYLRQSASSGLIAIADGVSSYEGGQTASKLAVEATLRAFGEQPDSLGFGKRLYRAVQQANIAVYDLAVVVPELRRMATTLTAVALDRGELNAAHVGDCRLYRVRAGNIQQLTKDHTLLAEKMRLGLVSEARARTHPGRSVLTRSVGRELIVAVDRITAPLIQGDVLVLCSDGLYNVLAEDELEEIVRHADAATACRSLIDAANRRRTHDNVTAAVVRMTGPIPETPRGGLGARLRRLFAGGEFA
jgi:protein phosphatase